MADQDEQKISDTAVVTKYKLAGEIVNKVLKKLVEKCVVGASVKEICMQGDAMILEETSKLYKKEKKIKKGIAFPVCASVNNCINHYSPLISDPDTVIADGDVVKLDFGAHIDGFIAVAGHTVVVGASANNKITGRKADVMLAAHFASEAALRLIRSGNGNYTVTDTVTKIAQEFKCKPVEGMLSFQLQKGRIDGDKTIVQNPTESQRKEVEKVEFETYEVYGIDVIISTGEGKGREMDTRITIYRKTDEIYNLKLRTSRELFSTVTRMHGVMPFNLRSCGEEKKARMGCTECVKHKLIDPYPVLWERNNEIVAQFKSTVLLMRGGPNVITGLPFDASFYESEHKIEDPEILKILKTSIISDIKENSESENTSEATIEEKKD